MKITNEELIKVNISNETNGRNQGRYLDQNKRLRLFCKQTASSYGNNIIPPISEVVYLFWCSDKITNFISPYACYMPRPFHSPCFDHVNNIM